VAGSKRLGFFRRRDLKPGMQFPVLVDNFELVQAKEAAQCPVARLTVRLFAGRTGPDEAANAGKADILFNGLKTAACASAYKRLAGLHCAAHRTFEREILMALDTLRFQPRVKFGDGDCFDIAHGLVPLKMEGFAIEQIGSCKTVRPGDRRVDRDVFEVVVLAVVGGDGLFHPCCQFVERDF